MTRRLIAEDVPVAWETVTKPAGGTRRLAHLHPTDAREYRRLVAAVLPTIERRLDRSVMANRAGPPPGPSLLAPWRPARLRWDRALQRALSSRRPPHALVTDVRDCYGSITSGAVVASLRRMGCAGRMVTELDDFLRSLAARGVRGLPVGPEPSAPLANAVLSFADVALRGLSVRHVRWVDDFVVFGADIRTLRRAEDALRRSVGEWGLTLHDGKTVLADAVDVAAWANHARASLADGRSVA
jgi:reverse transcriptase-like protein